MKTTLNIITILMLAGIAAAKADLGTPPVKSTIPYIATRNDAVRDMLWMANVGKDDVVYDLGSGDGRIVITAVRDFGVRRAVGIEIDPNRIQESCQNAKKAGVTDHVEFIQGDLFTTDFRQASVVTLFLGHQSNIELRPKIFKLLKPGTRIVSHQFCMGEWEPDKTLTARTVCFGMWGEMESPFRDNPHVPDYTGNEMHFGTSDKITMWVVPAAIAGVWRGKIETTSGTQDCRLILHQQLSKAKGMLHLSGQSDLTQSIGVDLWGDHVRLISGLIDQFEVRFDGHVHGDTMQGTLSVRENGQLKEHAWQVRRDKVDLVGTWELPCKAKGDSVKLRIQEDEGQLTAIYQDREETIPVTDFYNFGGGIYFTYLIGREKNGGLKVTDDTGWLIGEGVLDSGELKGTVEFYPYPRGMIPIPVDISP